jgi:dTDP-4-amino-4,6-dideoxygalactose transaminase
MSRPPVPLTRLDNADPALFEELLVAVERIARRAAFTLGEEVEAFEEEFATYCQTSFAVGVASGTDALALSLKALGRGCRPREHLHCHRRGGEHDRSDALLRGRGR